MSSHATLTARQIKFVENFLNTGNGTQAATAAGYSQVSARVSAHRLLTKPAIRAAISAKQSRDAKRLGIEREDVLRNLLDAYAMAKQLANPAAMVSAARECGRLMGYYAPERHQVEVAVDESGTMKRLNAMSDSELLAILERPAT